MPDALIVTDDWETPESLINKMVKIGLIKCVSCKGVKVYGRHYLTSKAIREAHKKQCV